MNTKKTVFILICVLVSVICLVVYNAFYSFDRKFTLLMSPKLNICFLISNDYKYEITSDGFKYSGQKNNGYFTLKHTGLSLSVLKVPINGFQAGYTKEKNFRIYEYLLPNSLDVLVDRFEYAQKAPMNIVPYINECDSFKKKFLDQKIIFND